MRLILRLVITAVALWCAVRFVDGISFTGNPVLLLAVALVFGVVNTIVKPMTWADSINGNRYRDSLILVAMPVVSSEASSSGMPI